MTHTRHPRLPKTVSSLFMIFNRVFSTRDRARTPSAARVNLVLVEMFISALFVDGYLFH